MVDQERAAKIRHLNDDTRINYRNAHFVITKGLAALGIEWEAIAVFRKFNGFTEQSDPFGEHDCFCFDAKGHKLIAKVDYYDPDMDKGSEDPTSTDPNICVRCWTLMLSKEY